MFPNGLINCRARLREAPRCWAPPFSPSASCLWVCSFIDFYCSCWPLLPLLLLFLCRFVVCCCVVFVDIAAKIQNGFNCWQFSCRGFGWSWGGGGEGAGAPHRNTHHPPNPIPTWPTPWPTSTLPNPSNHPKSFPIILFSLFSQNSADDI